MPKPEVSLQETAGELAVRYKKALRDIDEIVKLGNWGQPAVQRERIAKILSAAAKPFGGSGAGA